MKFKLVKKSEGRFHIVNETGDICGSATSSRMRSMTCSDAGVARRALPNSRPVRRRPARLSRNACGLLAVRQAGRQFCGAAKAMDSGRGVAALVKLALHCEDRLNLETLTLGTNLLLPGAACVGEFCGRHLLYVVAVDGERIRLLVTPMDKGDEPERIVSIDDTPENWMVIFRIVRGLGMERIG
jgi:hypothetical protein